MALTSLCQNSLRRMQHSAQETEPSNDIINAHQRHRYINLRPAWLFFLFSSFYSLLLLLLFFEKGAVGKEAWQNASATLSLSEEAHLAPILTLQKSERKDARPALLAQPPVQTLSAERYDLEGRKAYVQTVP